MFCLSLLKEFNTKGMLFNGLASSIRIPVNNLVISSPVSFIVPALVNVFVAPCQIYLAEVKAPGSILSKKLPNDLSNFVPMLSSG